MAVKDSIRRRSWRLLTSGWAILLLVSLLLPGSEAWAKPTTAAQARRVVQTWLSLDPQPLGAGLGGQVLEVQSFPQDAAEPDYFIVSLKPQGFVVVSADDLVEPLIAFVSSGRYDPSPDTPLGALVSRDAPGRIAQVRELERQARREGLEFAPAGPLDKARRKWQWLDTAGEAAGLSSEAGLPTVSTVWVAPFVQSRWGQEKEGSTACYNYYTPPYAAGTSTNYPCGCVATYMAQIMRYHVHPTVAVGTPTFNIYVDGVLVPNVPLRGGNGSGGTYDWGNMVLDPSASTPDIERQAIGALTYDAGVSVNMSYRSAAEGGSGATLTQSMTALRNTFTYSNTRTGYNGGPNIPLVNLYQMINPNLDARLPVAFDIRRPGGGHGVLADGYGYDLGTIYHHLNMGWSGSKDAWYNLPDISIPEWGRYYDTIRKCGYNIYPSGSGEIISGRVTNAGGNPIPGAAVVATRSGGGTYNATSDSRGIYALAKIPPYSSYTINVTKATYTFTPRTESTGGSLDDTLTVGNLWGADFTGSGGPKGFLPAVNQLLLMN